MPRIGATTRRRAGTPVVAPLDNNSSLSLANTAGAWTDVESTGTASARPTDLVWPATHQVKAGDWLSVNGIFTWGAEAPNPVATLFSIVAGSPVRNLAHATGGIPSWSSLVSAVRYVSGSYAFQVTADDISADGSVRVRLRYKSSTGPKTFYTGLAGLFVRLEGSGPFP